LDVAGGGGLDAVVVVGFGRGVGSRFAGAPADGATALVPFEMFSSTFM
jgi:hypothetical protein